MEFLILMSHKITNYTFFSKYMLKCNKHRSTEVKYEIYVKEHTLKRQVNTN